MATKEELKQALAEHRQAQTDGVWKLVLAVLIIAIVVGGAFVLIKRAENNAFIEAARQRP